MVDAGGKHRRVMVPKEARKGKGGRLAAKPPLEEIKIKGLSLTEIGALTPDEIRAHYSLEQIRAMIHTVKGATRKMTNRFSAAK